MSEMNRHSLKKNELEDIVVAAVTWIQANRQQVLTVTSAVGGIVLLSIFFTLRMNVSQRRASDKLAAGMSLSSAGQVAQALPLYDEVISQYGTTSSAAMARLEKASILSAQNKTAEAIAVLKPVVDAGKPARIAPLAAARLGALYEDASDFDRAIGIYSLFLSKFPGHFLSPGIWESMARSYMLSGKNVQARQTYEQIVQLFPDSPWGGRARAQLENSSPPR